MTFLLLSEIGLWSHFNSVTEEYYSALSAAAVGYDSLVVMKNIIVAARCKYGPHGHVERRS